MINAERIIKDIKEGWDLIFTNEIPEAKEIIDDILKEGSKQALDDAIAKFLDLDGVESKLKLIYGDDEEYDLVLVKPKTGKPGWKTEVLEFTEEEWATWWHENMSMQKKEEKVHRYVLYYKPETKTVVASLSVYAP
jgi:hypothetical protein